ncbi:MAG TPA: cytochrome c [Mucilaginibacter sp.]|nr:cytochrome c [Mucilaginibacter sp.]
MKLTAAFISIFLLAVILLASCENDQSIEFKRYYSSGALVYQTRCQNCHDANGGGLAALIPPLTDTAYLKNNRSRLACYVKFGLKGKLSINGREFDDEMQANDLTPQQLAQVLTYIGNTFGNKLGTVNEQEVAADLQHCQ